MTPADIFISYASPDREVARRYADAFEAAGFSVWWDDALRAGDAWDEAIEAALRSAGAVVVLWSKHSVVSRWVRAEATIADRNKTLVPAMIEPCERPIMFELTQTAELSRWTGDPDDAAWIGFLSDVRRFAGAQGGPARAAPAGRAAPRRGERGEAPSLAVLPFTNRSNLAEDEVFAVGIAEDVIDALSEGVNVRVIASSATARFRTDAIPDIEAMGRELGVRYLLEGNVRRIGANLRVAAQLVRARGGEILWTQKFHRPLSELAELQENLVVEVAAHLGAQVYRLEIERALRKPADLTAWECVTRAMAAYRRLDGENLLLAMREAARAVEIAPDYGNAQAMLASTTSNVYSMLCPDDPAEVRRISDYIEKALTADPDNAFVLTHVANAFCCIGRPEEGVDNAARAVALRPGYGMAHQPLAIGCAMLNRVAEALAHFEEFLRLEPGSHLHYITIAWQINAHIRAGDWAAAETAANASIALNPVEATPYRLKALIVDHLGRHGEARELARNVRQLEANTPFALLEMRMRRWFVNNPVADELVDRLRVLWAETEDTAPTAA